MPTRTKPVRATFTERPPLVLANRTFSMQPGTVYLPDMESYDEWRTWCLTSLNVWYAPATENCPEGIDRLVVIRLPDDIAETWGRLVVNAKHGLKAHRAIIDRDTGVITVICRAEDVASWQAKAAALGTTKVVIEATL